MEYWCSYVLFVTFFFTNDRLSGTHPFDGDNDKLGS